MTSSSSHEGAYAPSRPSEHYEDVALGGNAAAGTGGNGDMGSMSFVSDSTGEHHGDRDRTTGAERAQQHPAASYYPPAQSVEASYPPLPSFSRPSDPHHMPSRPTPASSSQHNSGPDSIPSSRYPPVRATFARLRELLDAQSPALLDSLSPPLPSNDPALASLKAAIAPYRLPQPVIDSYLLAHDGQDVLALGGSASGGASGGASLGGLGLFYGLWWLPLDRVEEEWRFWRRLEEAGGLVGSGVGGDPFAANATEAAKRARHASRTHPYVPEDATASPSRGNGTSSAARDDEQRGTSMQGMASFPDGWVRKRYSHPGWLPLLTDRCGNYIGIDLDPPPPPPASRTSSSAAGPKTAYGQPGQVIAFGREIDEKVVLFPGDGPAGWARFLAAFVDDLEKGEFARLGERPTEAVRNGWEARQGATWSDEEGTAANGVRRQGSEGSDEGDDGDGLGDRGYFETNMYGDEAVGNNPRAAQTWVLRPEYRRLSDELSLERGVIALLCERSRRKWQSLGVGSHHPAHRRTISIPIMRDGRILPSPRKMAAAAAAAAAANKNGKAAEGSTEAGGEQGVSLVLSPPSPKLAATSLPPPSPVESSSSQPGSPTSERLLHGPGRSPMSARSSSSSMTTRGTRNGRPAARRPPPPPPAPLDLPMFSELDFSDALGNQQPRPVVPPSTASWLLADPPAGQQQRRSSTTSSLGGSVAGNAMAEAGNMLSRLSFGSSSATSPLASPTLLPLAQNQSSIMAQQQAQAAAAMSAAGAADSRTALVGSPQMGGSPSSEAMRSPALSDSHVVVVEQH